MTTHEFNSRAYAEYFKIANGALKTIEKIKEHHSSLLNYGDLYHEQPNIEYIFFSHNQLKIICFDYAFSALENFLEHMGFILFDDWESNKQQRHYKQKYEKLIAIDKFVEDKNKYSNDFHLRETILQKANPNRRDQFATKRNPIKHPHAEIHEYKLISGLPINSMPFDQLQTGTYLDISDNDCIELITLVESLIIDVHKFLVTHKLILKISNDIRNDNKTIKRKSLWDTFAQ